VRSVALDFASLTINVALIFHRNLDLLFNLAEQDRIFCKWHFRA
jgi:hypothetical protein